MRCLFIEGVGGIKWLGQLKKTRDALRKMAL